MPKTKYLNLIKCTKTNRHKSSRLTGSLKKLDAKCTLFANPKLLHTVQMSNIYKDSKTFVDMVTRTSETEVMTNFDKLGEAPSNDDLKKFLEENFYDVGHDLIVTEPRDWYENAPFLSKINDDKLANFGRFLNSKWKMLLRNFDKSKVNANSKSTALHTKNSFVVPGGRFIEYYYWDTYWIVEGLLSSGMIQTARGIIENFSDIIKLAGFVPNGSRVYYLNRSQPPLLTQMVHVYYRVTNDTKLVEETLDQLDKEYEYWMNRKAVRVEINGERYKMNMYNVKSNQPRPESYKEDLHNAGLLNDKELYFSNIMSATESGWDFSSRWFQDPSDIKTIQITNMIPVDLNSIMFRNETILLEFHKLLGTRKAKFYEQAVRKRQKVMNIILWDKNLLTWGDYNIVTKKINSDNLYVSDLSPLWAGVEPPCDPNIVLARYKSLLMDHASGIPASNFKSGQQWDFPNVWAPYHHWMVDYFRRSNRPEIALDIARRFVSTVYHGWVYTNYIFEKYDADELGAYGGGGEYVVQEGFGWTNGVVIKFMEWFGDELKMEPLVANTTTNITNTTSTTDTSTNTNSSENQEKADYDLIENEVMDAINHLDLTNNSSEMSEEAKLVEDVDVVVGVVSADGRLSVIDETKELFCTEEEVELARSKSISVSNENTIISIQTMEII